MRAGWHQHVEREEVGVPLHRTAKGDNPDRALAQLIRRIERGGGRVVQVINRPAEWLIVATHSRPHDEWETR